jgi:hypothetical protein
MLRIPLLALLLLAGDSSASASASEDPWTEVRLTIARDPYSSSDHVTLCRVRAVNHGSRRWPGRSLAFEARARGGGVTVRERGRFGLELLPYGSLETLISLPGRHDVIEVAPLAPGDEGTRERKPRASGSGSKKRKRPRL